MGEIRKIAKLTALEILRLIDSSFTFFELINSKDKKKRFSLHRYLDDNAVERSNFFEKISYLKRRGLISRFCEDKESFAEVTNKGKNYLKSKRLQHLAVDKPKSWDKKWRVIIFDIPEKERAIRDYLRIKLYQIGFLQVQKSVFIYPFECTQEISLICDEHGGRQYIKYMIADILEGEDDIIDEFLDKGILEKSDLKS